VPQVAIRLLGFGLHFVFVGRRSAGAQDFHLLIRIRRIGNFRLRGRWRGRGSGWELRGRLLGEQRGNRKQGARE
jgi:hypothetical protein